jgi:hypothetical protein
MTGKPGDAKPMPYVQGHFTELGARFSPDGRWVAYVSTESGKNEIYVRPFTPGGASLAGDGKWMISNGNGIQPRWRRDGKQILYWNTTAGKLMAVDVEVAGASLKPGVPTPLFDLPIGGANGTLTDSWDITPDGSQILGSTEIGAGANAPITVVLNWQAALRR